MEILLAHPGQRYISGSAILQSLLTLASGWAWTASRALFEKLAAIAYRIVEGHFEFCLLLIPGDSRWEFPHGPIADGEHLADAALRLSQELMGFAARPCGAEPIGSFEFVSGGSRRDITAFLLQCMADHPVSVAAVPGVVNGFFPRKLGLGCGGSRCA